MLHSDSNTEDVKKINDAVIVVYFLERMGCANLADLFALCNKKNNNKKKQTCS